MGNGTPLGTLGMWDCENEVSSPLDELGSGTLVHSFALEQRYPPLWLLSKFLSLSPQVSGPMTVHCYPTWDILPHAVFPWILVFSCEEGPLLTCPRSLSSSCLLLEPWEIKLSPNRNGDLCSVKVIFQNPKEMNNNFYWPLPLAFIMNKEGGCVCLKCNQCLIIDGTMLPSLVPAFLW